MQLGMIGLGRMGANMSRRVMRAGHAVVGFDRSERAVAELAADGATGAASLAELVGALAAPRVVWMMVPAGEPVEQTIAELRPMLAPGDVLVDGGNSNFHDTKRRGAALEPSGIHYLDVGTSGGVWGLENGYCLMVGGPRAGYDIALPLLDALAQPEGCAYVGASGAGHYAKMVHNGIEYGMLQAYGEGFELLQGSGYDFDLGKLAALWNHGGVVRSWLLELAERAFAKEAGLESVRGYVEDSGEGRWTVLEAMDRSVPAPVITASLLARFASRRPESFSDKFIAALRNEFGGHAVKRKAEAGPGSEEAP